MKSRTFLACTAALFCGAFLAGCSKSPSLPVLQQIEYSNLADVDTQNLLSDLLQNAGVSELRTQTFFEHVQKFNNAVDPAWLTTGFETAKPLDLKYDPYSMQDAWTEKYGTFPGWNCRITACGLFGDFITVTGEADFDAAEDTLFMDYETLDTDPESLCGDNRQKFDALFAPVKTTNTTDIPTHLKTIQQEWKRRGLSFVEDDKIRLISVVLHDQFSETDSSLMIGHVGVMLPTSDAVYFVEKVAFQEPYRLLKFKNRTELSDYLMLKYDNSWGQDKKDGSTRNEGRQNQACIAVGKAHFLNCKVVRYHDNLAGHHCGCQHQREQQLFEWKFKAGKCVGCQCSEDHLR